LYLANDTSIQKTLLTTTPRNITRFSKKSSNILKLEALNRRTDNRMVKRKRTDNDLENTTLNREWTQVLRTGNLFLLHYPWCYSSFKPSDKSWIMKGPTEHIHGHERHRYSLSGCFKWKYNSAESFRCLLFNVVILLWFYRSGVR